MLRNMTNAEGEGTSPLFSAPRLRKATELWDRLATSRPPRRTDFPPEALRENLGYVAIVEHNQNACFNFRLAGTELVRRARRELTGLSFDELYSGDQLMHLNALFSRALAFGRPHRAVGLSVFGDENTDMEVALLPVCGNDGRTYTQVLAIFAFSGVPQQRSYSSFR
ncbi:PAS domain-containing protein [Lacibacterium aquatile]|uniref:PAS domain-containing protein n=1 Tax=Lacibacterium aquatile TaxID=1168082 RepID=A0ABW5DUM3_9PROT